MTTIADDRLQLLLDERDIRELIEAYVHACDRADRDAVADVYWPDSWDDHGPMKCSGSEFATLVTDALATRWRTCNHLLGQSRIRVAGDVAGAETLFFASLTRDGEGEGEQLERPMIDMMVGRYVDRIERRGGEWKIKDRRCISEWSSSMPAGEDFMRGDLFLSGARSGDDLSYAALGLTRGRSRLPR